MPSIINTAFEFVPIAIFTALFLFLVLYVKYKNKMSLRSVGSDICLGALFVQITLLALPVWMAGSISANIKGHVIVVLLTLITWIITAKLLDLKKPLRTRSKNIYRRVTDYLVYNSDLRETLSFIAGVFALSISFMMMLDTLGFNMSDWKVQTTQLIMAILASIVFGYAGYSVYGYLQNEQFTHSFERFSREITRDNLLLAIQSGGSQKHDRDPTQPVVDIIRGSIMRGALEPALFGLNILKKNSIEVLTTSGMRKYSMEKVTLHFISHIDEIGKLALRMDEDEAAMESIGKLGEIGEVALSRNIEVPAEEILRRLSEYYEVLHSKEYEIMKLAITGAINRVGVAAASHKIEAAASRASNMLGLIGTPAVREMNKSILNKTINSLYNIAKESAENSLESALKQSAIKLRDMGTSGVQIGYSEEPLRIISYLKELGEAAASNKLEVGTEQVVWAIKDIGMAFGYQRNERGINEAIGALAGISMEASGSGLNDAVDQSLWSIKEVSMYPIAENMSVSIASSAQSLAMIANIEHEKVNKTLDDIKRYFGSEETKRFDTFHQEFESAKTALAEHK